MCEKINVIANIILFTVLLWSLYRRYNLEKDIKILKWQVSSLKKHLDHSRKIFKERTGVSASIDSPSPFLHFEERPVYGPREIVRS